MKEKDYVVIGTNQPTENIRSINAAEIKAIEDRINNSKFYKSSAHEPSRILIDQNNVMIRQNEEIIRYLKALYVTMSK